MGYNIVKQQRTQKQITDAFISLYETNTYDKITVLDICSKANVHRSTFYLHYENIDFMLREIEDHLLEEITNYNIIMNAQSINQSADTFHIRDLMNFYYEHRNYIRPLLSPHGDAYFTNKLKKIIGENLEWTLHKSKAAYGNHQKYIISYISSGIMNTIYNWLIYDDLTVDEITEILNKMVFENPFWEYPGV
ncbi:MAG: TetR/AcrR family transcriptional regulator [Eubacteriaceae bacterium]|nr:TetR/AcrR family transcriptional regulator [Eubacteriaceae bacterium]